MIGIFRPFGAGFSIEPRILQSAWFRPHNVSEEVPGLYLTGAGTHPGGRVAGRGIERGSSGEIGSRSGGGTMINRDDMAYCREAIRHGSLVVSRGLRAFCPRGSVTRPWRCTRFADWRMTRSIFHAGNRLLWMICGGGLIWFTPVNPGTLRPIALSRRWLRCSRCRAPCRRHCLKGLAWDAEMRRYANLSELTSYSARVASAVGVMMCVLMKVRDRHALARAADLGVAMQLTNIARDVGEGRVGGAALFCRPIGSSMQGLTQTRSWLTRKARRPCERW